jgi:hypothetical protein
MGNTTQKKGPEPNVWQRPSMSVLEADLAYFDARLTMMGDRSGSSYLAAQRRAFESLTKALKEMVEQLRGERKRLKRRKLEEMRERRGENGQGQDEPIEIFENTVITGPRGESLDDLLEQLNDERIVGLDRELERLDDHIQIVFEDGKSEEELEMEPVYYIDVDSRSR